MRCSRTNLQLILQKQVEIGEQGARQFLSYYVPYEG